MQPVREVYSLLMPVHGGRIIVPRAAVAEVMGYSKPKDRPEDAPAFVLGFVEWQNQRIPLVSFEAARGGDVPELGRRTRIAVVFGIADRLKPNVFAVVTQGYPYLVRVNENVLHSEAMETEEPLILARVRMANEKPFVPDLEKLELLIAESLGIAGDEADATAPVEPVDELDVLGLGDEEEFGDALLDDEESGDVSFDVAGDALDSTASETEKNETFIDTEAPDLSDQVAGDEEDLETVAPDLDEVTAFGADTNYSSELDELTDSLEEMSGEEEAETASVDLNEVTAFGAETNYSSELDELSSALQGNEEEIEVVADDDEYAIDLSDLSTEESGETEDDDANALDFSDLELDDEDEKKSGD